MAWIHLYRLELFYKMSEKFHNRWSSFKIVTALFSLFWGGSNCFHSKVCLCFWCYNFTVLMNWFIKLKLWVLLLKNSLMVQRQSLWYILLKNFKVSASKFKSKWFSHNRKNKRNYIMFLFLKSLLSYLKTSPSFSLSASHKGKKG